MKTGLALDAPLAWGFEFDGELINACVDPTKPRKVGRNGYTNAFHALGYKPVRVRIIRERDYQRLLKAVRK